MNIFSSIGKLGSACVRSSLYSVPSMRERCGPAGARTAHVTAMRSDVIMSSSETVSWPKVRVVS